MAVTLLSIVLRLSSFDLQYRSADARSTRRSETEAQLVFLRRMLATPAVVSCTLAAVSLATLGVISNNSHHTYQSSVLSATDTYSHGLSLSGSTRVAPGEDESMSADGCLQG